MKWPWDYVNTNLKAPFPWFGGKSRVAHLVWANFGNVPNYVEPFAGSLAVLLGRPHHPKTETVNDADCYLSNFWRALKWDPAQLAIHADWPVNEADLSARHRWLIAQSNFRESIRSDPDYFDTKIAGWWIWGLCSWIGDGWCHAEFDQLPHLGNAGMGINRKRPHLGGGMGINRRLPHLGNAGMDVHHKRPHLMTKGKATNRDGLILDGALLEYFKTLSLRLRKVRVCCGDWMRVLGETVTIKHGVTGVFLDPPYAGDRNMSYAVDSHNIGKDVQEWAIANGDNPLLRIAICGYSGEVHMPDSWTEIAWKAQGGYGSQANGNGRKNSKRERIWFSKHCGKQLTLYTQRTAPCSR